MPKRIQRQRTRGWKKPKGSICVTRGTAWGNPFVVRPDLEPGTQINRRYIAVPTVEDAVECFRIRLTETPEDFPPIANLKGKDLACWCSLDQRCHADVLLEVANQQKGPAMVREISQREYDAQERRMNNIYGLTPLMRETLVWLLDPGFGCPGTNATFKALTRRGLAKERGPMRGWEITEAGRAVAAQK